MLTGVRASNRRWIQSVIRTVLRRHRMMATRKLSHVCMFR
jgi:hypothetical protein